MVAVGNWVAFSMQELQVMGNRAKKVSKPWPRVICTSSLGPFGCLTMQCILDLFTPHLASKPTTMGGGRGRVRTRDHGSICRPGPWKEIHIVFWSANRRSEDSDFDYVHSWWEDRLITVPVSEGSEYQSLGRQDTRRGSRQDLTCGSE